MRTFLEPTLVTPLVDVPTLLSLLVLHLLPPQVQPQKPPLVVLHAIWCRFWILKMKSRWLTFDPISMLKLVFALAEESVVGERGG